MTDILNRQSQDYGLEDFLDAVTLQEIQAAFTAGTGMQVCFYDRSGKRVTQPAEPAEFCSRPADGDDNRCARQRSIAAACEHGPRGALPLSCDGRHCHMAIPIRSDQQVLGMLVLG